MIRLLIADSSRISWPESCWPCPHCHLHKHRGLWWQITNCGCISCNAVGAHCHPAVGSGGWWPRIEYEKPTRLCEWSSPLSTWRGYSPVGQRWSHPQTIATKHMTKARLCPAGLQHQHKHRIACFLQRPETMDCFDPTWSPTCKALKHLGPTHLFSRVLSFLTSWQIFLSAALHTQSFQHFHSPHLVRGLINPPRLLQQPPNSPQFLCFQLWSLIQTTRTPKFPQHEGHTDI